MSKRTPIVGFGVPKEPKQDTCIECGFQTGGEAWSMCEQCVMDREAVRRALASIQRNKGLGHIDDLLGGRDK